MYAQEVVGLVRLTIGALRVFQNVEIANGAAYKGCQKYRKAVFHKRQSRKEGVLCRNSRIANATHSPSNASAVIRHVSPQVNKTPVDVHTNALKTPPVPNDVPGCSCNCSADGSIIDKACMIN